MLCAGLLVQSSPEIKAWMREHDVTSISGLETYFEERVLALASAAGRSYIVWQVRKSPCLQQTAALLPAERTPCI